MSKIKIIVFKWNYYKLRKDYLYFDYSNVGFADKVNFDLHLYGVHWQCTVFGKYALYE